MLSVVFLFQAEDGIRDLVRSRGLGDVYKRQRARLLGRRDRGPDPSGADRGRTDRQHGQVRPAGPVSYTHLTLPTSDLV